MKAYTDLEQSKKLAEILPLESADMSYDLDIDKWEYHVDLGRFSDWIVPKYAETKIPRILPCWSLAALLTHIPNVSLHHTPSGWRTDSSTERVTAFGPSRDNPIDACVEMIFSLKDKDLI